MAASYKLICKNIWGLIGNQLRLQDLLELRRSCKWLNQIVKGMNARWYRAHQWFMGKHVNKNRVKSAVRVHHYPISSRCVAYNNNPLIDQVRKDVFDNSRIVPVHQILQYIVDNEMIKESDCNRTYHWITKIPTSEREIPLEPKQYKPKRNIYMYWYLVEAYRVLKRKHEKTLLYHEERYANAQKTQRRSAEEIRRLQDRIERAKKSEAYHAQLKEKLKGKYAGNDIFKNFRVNNYKGI